MIVMKIVKKIELAAIKLSRKLLGVKAYMKYYTKYLQKCGVKIEDFNGDGFIAPTVMIDNSDCSLISIGNGTTIADDAILLTHDYSIRKALTAAGYNAEKKRYRILKPITIGRNVFIGMRAILLPGSNIGDNVIIGAGSIVHGSIPENTVWGGAPARQLCTIEEYAKKHYASKDYCI